MKTAKAAITRQYLPLADEGRIHGLTWDGSRVWLCRDEELVAFDPKTERVVKRHAVPGAAAGTAFDGTHLYQLAKGEILVLEPDSGRVVRTLPAPGKGEDSGMAWSDGYLWIGQYHGAKIHKVDPKTGEIVKTLTSDRFVTGVSFADGALWHATMQDGKPTEIRRLASDGTVEEVLDVPTKRLAGMEADGAGGFWCAGENGRVLLVTPR